MGNGSGNSGGGGAWSGVDFSALPEGCVAHILSFTTPQDVCRLAVVSSGFRAASEADGVWDRFFPPEYRREISDAAARISPSCPSKKDLFLYLCHHPILIHGGAKSFSLDKRTGKKCFMISPRELSIVWGDAPRYWRWTSPPEASRFGEIAELVSVCWLEVRGKIETGMLSSNTLYAAYLVFKPTTSNYGFQHQPVEVGVGLVGTETSKQNVYLDVVDREWRRRHQIMSRGFGLFNLSRRRIIGTQEAAMPREINARTNEATTESFHRRAPEERGDGWLEVQLGEFFHDGVEGELEMSMAEVKGGHWKGGLLIQGVEIRPKALKT